MEFQNSFTALAGEAITANRLVKFSSAASGTDPVTVTMCDAGEDAIGVARVATASGDPLTVYLLAGVLKIELGATLAAGADAYCGANGVLAATGSGPSFKVLRGGSSGEVGTALPPGQQSNAAQFTANIQTLSADLVLTAASDMLQVIDPNGARDLRLPPEAEGLHYVVVNEAGGAEDITVTDDGDTGTIATISQGETGSFWCDGTTWHALVGATT